MHFGGGEDSWERGRGKCEGEKTKILKNQIHTWGKLLQIYVQVNATSNNSNCQTKLKLILQGLFDTLYFSGGLKMEKGMEKRNYEKRCV